MDPSLADAPFHCPPDKPRRKARRPEQDIQRTVFKHLRQRPAAGVFAFHCPNGGARSRVEASIFKGIGVTSGVPDVLVIKDGQLYGLELKADDGKISEQQLCTLRAMQEAGARVAVATGLDNALRKLEEWQLLRGTAA